MAACNARTVSMQGNNRSVDLFRIPNTRKATDVAYRIQIQIGGEGTRNVAPGIRNARSRIRSSVLRSMVMSHLATAAAGPGRKINSRPAGVTAAVIMPAGTFTNGEMGDHR